MKGKVTEMDFSDPAVWRELEEATLQPPASEPNYEMGLRIVEALVEKMVVDRFYGDMWANDHANHVIADCWEYLRRKDHPSEEGEK